MERGTPKRGATPGEALAAFGVFVLVAAGWLGANPFAGEVVAPMDLLLHREGWAESGLRWPVSATRASDVIDGFLPKWIFLKEEIHAGRLPLWNPAPGGGIPAAGILSHGYATPRFLLFLLLDDGLGYTLGLIAQAALCALGLYVLCRTGLGVVPSAFAGVTWMMSGFNSVWAFWPHVSTGVWMPWVFWALLRLSERPAPRRVAALAFLVALLVLGGYPPVGAFALYAAAFFAGWLFLSRGGAWRSALRFALGAAAGVALGFGLGGFQLVPFAEFLGQIDLSYRFGGGETSAVASNLWQVSGNRNAAYVGVLTLALAALAAVRFRDAPSRALQPLFWLTLAGLALSIALDRPRPLSDLLRSLPVIGWNPGSRMFVVFAVAMAVPAAVGLERLLRVVAGTFGARAGPLAAFAAGAAIVALQTADLGRIGRGQNPVVPREAFYPETPTLRYVRDALRPGQSVLATSDGFAVAGTLGAYGIPEWLAHTLQVKGQREVLGEVVRDAWVSPSAAEFHLGQVRFDPVWFDALGICCVLVPEGNLFGQRRKDAPSPPLPPHRIGQTLRLTQASVVREVRVASQKGRLRSGGETLSLAWQDAGGRELAAAAAAGRRPERRAWIRFPLRPPLELEPGEYRFELSLPGAATARPVRVWTHGGPRSYAGGSLLVDGREKPRDLTFWVRGAPILDAADWRASTPGRSIRVIERTAGPPGAYVVPPGCAADEPSRDCVDGRGVDVVAWSSDRAVYRVESPAGGTLVRTMRRWPGWKAFVNGREAPIGTHLGLLPAVEIGAGESVVEWRYEPWSWPAGLALTAVSLLALLILVVRRSPVSAGGSGSPR